MSRRFWETIEWSRPWLAPLMARAEPVMRASDWRAALNCLAAEQGLKNHRGLPVHFVPQESLPRGMAYEAFISATGGVPTRENLHDFFNALVWLMFSKIKVRLNALQAAELARSASLSASRGKLRDAATIFDENAAILIARDPALVDALRTHDWHEVFIERRHQFGSHCEVWIFGHALMEKLVAPYKAITAHAWPLIADEAYFGLSTFDKQKWIDLTVADQLESGLTTAAFTPLPVLGVPGWWQGQDEPFYADQAVFRPKRRLSA